MYDHANLPVFQKSYDLYKKLTQERIHIPKIERYHLWLHIETESLRIIELIIESQHVTEIEKLGIIRNMSKSIDLLRIFVRLAHETDILSKDKYLNLEQDVDTIGRMLG